MKKYKICRKNRQRKFTEIAEIKAPNPRKAVRYFLQTPGKKTKANYYVVYQQSEKLTFKV